MLDSARHMYVCKASAGTGKTYTLAAHYIALLMNDVPSKHILAVTFTNKATEEMKQRIITYLNAMASYGELDDTRQFISKVMEVSQQRGLRVYSSDEYARRARVLLDKTLSDYDEVSISTIDSFLQTLLTGLAQAIGQAAGFGVDLDIKHAITTAVDEVLSMDVAEDEHLRSALVRCLNERLHSEDKWDLRPNLIRLTEQLYHENVQELQQHIPLVDKDHPEYASVLSHFYQSLLAFRDEPPYQTLRQAYLQMGPWVQPLSSGTGGKAYASFLKKCEKLIALNAEWPQLSENDYNRLTKPDKLPQIAPADLPLLHDQVDLILSHVPSVYAHVVRYKVCKEYLNDLLLAGYVIDRIRRDQRENNTFLLAQTAYTLIQALDRHDAQFILMKAGIRYHHIMLDEFQDTSSLQWQNFRLLLEEILSVTGGSVLIVGDVKQSIYRWRNGDYQIMNGLDQPQPDSQLHRYYQPQQLICNRRSRKEIVAFNLDTFYRLAHRKSEDIPYLPLMYEEQYDTRGLEDFYDQTKPGGYVCLRQFIGGQSSEENERAKEELLEFMFLQMEDLLDHGYRPKDMLILTRTASESKRVLRTFRRVMTDQEHYPHLCQAGKIISNDSFLLESSLAVNTVISGLKMMIRHDQVAQAYIEFNHPCVDLSALLGLEPSLPLTDMVEQIIQCTLCPNGVYEHHDLAYLNCLRDKLRQYIGTYGSNAEDFLQYWDDKMHAESIPATDSDDIRIMTIHSSKGLQAKNVFIPFCAWKEEVDATKKEILWCPMPYLEQHYPDKSYLPVTYGGDLQAVPELQSVHDEEQRKQYIDSLNLLYVACTRAEDNLFILVNKNSRTGKTVGSWLTELYGEEWEFGHIQYPVVQVSKERIPEPFSFVQASTLEAQYHSEGTSIQFRQSRLSQQMMRSTPSLEDNSDNIAFGNLCHAILEKVQTAQDVEHVVHDFFLRGAIPTPKEEQQMIALLNRLMTHPTAGTWFDGSYQLLQEDMILTYRQEGITECRMDRVMIRGNRVIVLDYKFGKPQSEYTVQVQNYMRTMMQMGYTDVQGYLWYGFAGQLEEVTLE